MKAEDNKQVFSTVEGSVCERYKKTSSSFCGGKKQLFEKRLIKRRSCCKNMTVVNNLMEEF